jgi:hypothetical protein
MTTLNFSTTTEFMSVDKNKIATARKAVAKIGRKYNLFIDWNYVWNTCAIPEDFPNLRKQVKNIINATGLPVIFI